MINFERFYSFSTFRKKHRQAKRFSGGITILIKKEWRKGVKITDDKNESYIWWKMSKGFFNFSNDIYVCSIYIPPSNSSREKNVQTDHFRAVGTAAALSGLSVFLFTENPLKCFIL